MALVAIGETAAVRTLRTKAELAELLQKERKGAPVTMDNKPNNYCRRLYNRNPREVLLFRSEEGLPEVVRENPSDWVVWELRPFSWRSTLHRVGEDADAREARLLGVARYTNPLPPAQGVGNDVVIPYRRLSLKQH
jgi:hypothetical protein